MATTIRTNSPKQFGKIQNYLYNKRVFSTPAFNNGVYSITIFGLTTAQANELILKMTRHFHLISKSQQEPLALAA